MVPAVLALASCIPVLEWQSFEYAGYGSEKVRAGAALAAPATIPGCNDVVVNGELRIEPDHVVAVRRVRGVDPMFAVMQGGGVYVNVSTFPQLPSHPLYKQLGRGSEPPRRASPACTVSGRAVVGPMWFGLQRGRKPVRIEVTRRTDVRLRRGGTGYVPAGTPIRVTGGPCRDVNGVFTVTARRVSPGR
jgi:hypothetical protein